MKHPFININFFYIYSGVNNCECEIIMKTTFVNRAIDVTKEGNQITSVVAKHIESGKEQSFEAPLFSDCTGDGTIGFLAGSDYQMGREARDEFGESAAPEKADKMTMRASVQWYSVDNKKSSPFPFFNYGVEFNDKNCEPVMMGGMDLGNRNEP